jgi:uncharacterized protein (TIGR00369 family)
MPTQRSPTRRDVMRQFIPASPMVRRLGIELVDLSLDRAELALPYDDGLATTGDVVHGGAIASLIDTAGMAATWSDDAEPESLSGSTINMNVSYVAAARGKDLRAVARVVRRGRRLCFTEITVTEPDGRIVATGTVVQQFGSG